MDGIDQTVIFDLIFSNMLSLMVVGLFFAGLELAVWFLDLDGVRHQRQFERLWSKHVSAKDDPIWIYETFLRLPKAEAAQGTPERTTSSTSLLFKA